MDFEAEMPTHVATAFYEYIALPHRRSLERLVAIYRKRRCGPEIATLKRWSLRFHWQECAHAHDRKTVEVMEERFNEAMGEKIARRAQSLARLKQNFYDCVDLDPDDPSLTPEQRRRVIRPTLAGFVKLLKIERMLLPQLHDAGPEKPDQAGDKKSNFTEEEFAVMMNALTRFRHDLPPPQ